MRYTLPNGKSGELESNVGTNPPRFQVGEVVDVLYNPNQVSDVRLKADVEFVSGLGGVFVLIGGGMIVAGFYIKA